MAFDFNKPVSYTKNPTLEPETGGGGSFDFEKSFDTYRPTEDYTIGEQVIRTGFSNSVMPILQSFEAINTLAAEQVEAGVTPSIAASPFQAYGMQSVPSSQTLQDIAGTGQALKQADELRNYVRTFTTEVGGVSPDFIENHPFLHGSMAAIGQLPTQVFTGGTTIIPQLYSGWNMEAENRLGKPRSEWTQEEKVKVDTGAIPYVAVASLLERLGLGGVASKPLQSFLRGEKIKSSVLQRIYQNGRAGAIEGATEWGQEVLQDVGQIIMELDPNEEINYETFMGKDKMVALVSGGVGGSTVNLGLQTVEALTIPDAKVSNEEMLFDTAFTVRYVDKDGNPVEFTAEGPDKQTVYDRVMQSQGDSVMEGSPVQVTEYQGATSGPEQTDTTGADPIEQAKLIDAEVLDGGFDLPSPTKDETAEAMSTYVNKKYVGPEGKVPESPGYANFLQSLGVQQYTEGRFIEISGPNKGTDLTNETFTGGSVSIVNGKPVLLTEDTQAEDIGTLKSTGPLVKTNLFKKSAGWKWTDQPQGIETNTLVSVEQGRNHYYTLDFQVNNPIKLANYKDAPSEPRGRPTTRGKPELGNKIGEISVRGKSHPVYDTITVGKPKTIEDLEEISNALSSNTAGPVSIERVREQNKLKDSFFNDTAAFYEFYLGELNKTGNMLDANPNNIKMVAEQMVGDTTNFLAENPHLVSFYEEDTKLTNSYLSEAFNMDKADYNVYAVIDGLMSANTSLAGNSIDSLRAFQDWKKTGNFDAMVLKQSDKGNVAYDKNKSDFLLHGTSAPNKARAVKSFGKIIDEMGPEAAVNYLTTPVNLNELRRFNKALGYKTNPKVGDIKKTVMPATGQDELVPRAFVFGPKVGSYVMNNLGYLNYTTIDIWESRFIRSYFKGMLDMDSDLPKTVDERELFQEVGDEFQKVLEEKTGQKYTKATAQALRWFYVLDTFAKLGYKGASTNESKSEYTRQGIKRVLGVDLSSGRRSNEEGARTAQFEFQNAGSISPAQRARFRIREFYDRISYRGRESTDPRAGYQNVGRGNIDLTVSEFVQAAKQNKVASKFGSSVDVLSEDDYGNHTLILYKSPQGGTVTVSVAEDGELGTVTKSPEGANKSDVRIALLAAIGTGRVKWANAFDTVLPDIYVPYGFKPVYKLKFDPKQAPKDWDSSLYKGFNGGKPPVVFFTFTGEMNRRYVDFKDVPETDSYDVAFDAVSRTDISGEGFDTGYKLMDAVYAEFQDIAKKLGTELEHDISRPTQYVAYSKDQRRGGFIRFNPLQLIERSREGVRSAIREELVHALQHQALFRNQFPSLNFESERKKGSSKLGDAWRNGMISYGRKLSEDQRDALKNVYLGLPDITTVKEQDLDDVYKAYGAEYLRVSFQYSLFNETPEMFVEGGPAWDAVTKLFEQSHSILGSQFDVDAVKADLNLADLIVDSAEVLQSVNINKRMPNQKVTEAAYASSVPKRNRENPMNPAERLFNGIMVPFQRNLEDIHPVFRQLEIDLNFNKNTKTIQRKRRVKRFADKLLLEVKDPVELARISHFISYNPKTKEEMSAPYGKYLIHTRNELLKKYGMLEDYNEIVRPLLNELYNESQDLQMKSGFRYEYYPRFIKDFKGLKAALDPRNLGTFEQLVSEINRKRRINGEDIMTEDERAALMMEFLRGGVKNAQPLGVKLPQNLNQRLLDIVPESMTQYYEHPAKALYQYIENMTDAIETYRVYGKYRPGPDGGGALTGEFGRQADRLLRLGQISSYEANERLPEMIKIKLAKRGRAEGMEWIPMQNIRALTYGSTIAKFSTTLANLLDTEIALYETGPATTLGALMSQHNVTLSDFGILAGKEQVEFNFDEKFLAKSLENILTVTGFYGADRLGKATVAKALLDQARARAKKAPDSKQYKALVKDIDLFFPLKTDFDKQNLIKDLAIDAPESLPVFNYIFHKMSNIQPISEANYPPFYLQYPQLRFMWALQTFAINRLNYNRKVFMDDLIGGSRDLVLGDRMNNIKDVTPGATRKAAARRVRRAVVNLTQLAISMALVGIPIEMIRDWMNGRNFYLPDTILNTLARLGYGNIYQQKMLVMEGLPAFLLSLTTPAGTVVGDASTDLYKVMTGQKPWSEADAIKRARPFRELWALLFNENEEQRRRTWLKKADKGQFPTFNSNYLGD